MIAYNAIAVAVRIERPVAARGWAAWRSLAGALRWPSAIEGLGHLHNLAKLLECVELGAHRCGVEIRHTCVDGADGWYGGRGAAVNRLQSSALLNCWRFSSLGDQTSHQRNFYKTGNDALGQLHLGGWELFARRARAVPRCCQQSALNRNSFLLTNSKAARWI